MNYTDSDYTLWPKGGSGTLHQEYEHENSVWVETPKGYVSAISFNYKKWKHTRLSLIKDGREYNRVFRKHYTNRGLVTKAKQFAKDIYGE